MLIRFDQAEKYCQNEPPYLIPVVGCEAYSFAVPKTDVPVSDSEPFMIIGFETCDGARYSLDNNILTDGSECDYIDRTAVAYFQVKSVAPFNCKTDEIIIIDANARIDCAEGATSAITSGGLPENFGSGLRAFYGTVHRIGGAQDYIDYLLFISAIPGANSPYYGTMTHIGNGIIKWEIPEPDFITAFGHSPNEVRLSFCSNGTNFFEIDVLQDFETCLTADPNGLYVCGGIAWARFTDTSNFPLQVNQSIIFTYKESACASENAIIELRWDNPAAATIFNISDYLDWLILQSGGWIINKFISGSDVYIYFNVGYARDIGVELCGTFFKFCGYSYGSGYGYNPPPDPLWAVTQPICCNADTLCPKRYDYWFAKVCLPALPIGARGRFFITTIEIGSGAPIYYSNELIYVPPCESTYIRFRNNQDYAGQPYSQYPLFWNRIRLGFLFRDVSYPKKEIISRNSAGLTRRIYSQSLIKYLCETDYFDYITHDFFALALQHDSFEVFDEEKGYFIPYVCEGDYDVNTPNVRPFVRTAKAQFSLTQSDNISTNSYC